MNYKEQIAKVFTGVESSNIQSYYQSKPGAPVYVIFKSGWNKTPDNSNGQIYEYRVSDIDDFDFGKEVIVHGSAGRAVVALKQLTDGEFTRIYYAEFLETVKKPVIINPSEYFVPKPEPVTNVAAWL